jgi:hypothetical protein
MSQTQNYPEDPVRLPPAGETLCGLKRGFILNLCLRGIVRSKIIAIPGSARRVRVLYKSSLLSFINNSPDGTESTDSHGA